METSTGDHRRLLMEINTTVKEINRETINPEFSELTLDDLEPVLRIVAIARRNYLKKLFDIATNSSEDGANLEDIKQLRLLRATFEELLEGAQALDTAIERGYLDVEKQ